MRRMASKFLAAVFIFVIGFAGAMEAQAMNTALNARQQSIVVISACTANGNLNELKTALNEGLDAGVTVSEIKEILVQLYAYAGFPRSLNAIHTFMNVIDEREAKGIKDEPGREPTSVAADLDRDDYGAAVRAKLAGQQSIPAPSGYQLFTPLVDAFLKEHLFADIFSRDNLDFQTRELATISALAALSGTAGQLQFHLGAAMNMGLTEAQLKQFVDVLNARIGSAEAANAGEVLAKVLSARK